MKNVLNHFYEAETEIIKAVAGTEFPIIVTGKKGSGKSTMGRLITTLNSSRIIFTGEASQISYWAEIQKRNEVDLSKYVFIVTGEEGDLPTTVGPHIKINTFNPASLDGYYFRVSPQLNKAQFNGTKLTPEEPFHIIVADNFDDREETYRPIVSLSGSNLHSNLEEEIYEVSGSGGIKLINLNFNMILNMDDNYLEEGINVGTTSHNIKVFNLRATSEELASLDTSNLKRLLSEFDRHRIMMLIVTDKLVPSLIEVYNRVNN